MRLRMFGATDKGLVRATNQDAYYCNAEWGMAVVSDGMGGHKGGERASQLTTQGLRDAFHSRTSFNIEDISAHLDETLQEINYEIHRMAQEDENLHGMGATVNYLHFTGGHVAIGHAGDSRTYLARAFLKSHSREVRYGLWQLTIDHNVESFVERGLLIPGRDLPEGPLSERQKARLTRGMGVVENLKADLYCRKIEDGDVYLTCSDGLHGFVSDRDILQGLIAGPIEEAPERLIALAIAAGAPDNVTVVVSVASTSAEPLLKCKEPSFSKPPFLARDSSGQISQLLSAETLIKKWMNFEISNEAEICSSNGKWIFLQKRKALFRAYPEFDHPSVRERLDQVAPQSATGNQQPLEARSGRKQSTTRSSGASGSGAQGRSSNRAEHRQDTQPRSLHKLKAVLKGEEDHLSEEGFSKRTALGLTLGIGMASLLIFLSLQISNALRLLLWQVY